MRRPAALEAFANLTKEPAFRWFEAALPAENWHYADRGQSYRGSGHGLKVFGCISQCLGPSGQVIRVITESSPRSQRALRIHAARQYCLLEERNNLQGGESQFQLMARSKWPFCVISIDGEPVPVRFKERPSGWAMVTKVSGLNVMAVSIGTDLRDLQLRQVG